jgi:hypothetical protein
VYLFWLAVRVEVESKDFANLGDVPGVQNCTLMHKVGPVRTRTYKHPHGPARTWIAGTCPDSSFEDFVYANGLFLDEADDSSNRWLKAPAEFVEWFEFVPNDTPLMLFGKLPGCETYLKGLYSKRTGNFILLIGSPQKSSH